MGGELDILGLHFGHDGAVCVLKDGVICSYVLRERLNRTKHALGISDQEIDLALRSAGLAHTDIDCIAITSTQGVELMTGLIKDFEISIAPTKNMMPTTLTQRLGITEEQITAQQTFSVRPALTTQPDDFGTKLFENVFPEARNINWETFATVGWLDNYVTATDWNPELGLSELGSRRAKCDEDLRFGFHLPITVRWRDRQIPACFVQHHMAHGASCYYRSGFSDAGVLTHDGFLTGSSYHSGLYLYGNGHHLWPISPNHLTLGMMYDFAARNLGLGFVHGAGKLMGLAPYGDPVLFDRAFVGNEADIKSRFGVDLWTAWWEHCRKQVRRLGYDMSALGDAERVTEPINADIAASTQRLFEETYLLAVQSLNKMLIAGDIGSDNLCLSGGTALNCPSNSRVWREGPFSNIFIEPTCDDSGLAIGAALHLYHNLLDRPRKTDARAASPYIGTSYQNEIDILLSNADDIRWEHSKNPIETAVSDLLANRIIAWYEGQSEAGPRALGHRSILADARSADNWLRVNLIKEREPWRPFAPIVLKEKSAEWFSGCPIPSPYMLFTAIVKGNELPAITHVDGSSRIQTVDSSCGGIRRILEVFDEKTGVPVLMNTSFNGPGEPIVETPEEAITFLLHSKIDAVYIEGRRVIRA